MQLAASEVKDNLSQSEPRISSVIPTCGCKLRVFVTGKVEDGGRKKQQWQLLLKSSAENVQKCKLKVIKEKLAPLNIQNSFLVTSGFCLLNDTAISQARGFQLFQRYTNGQLKTGVCVKIHSFYMNTTPRTLIYARVKFREPQNSLRRKQYRRNNKRIGIQLL